MERYLIGIDDTDNAESRGTGFRARQLGALLEKAAFAIVHNISRHQLLFDRRIPYTSHNSSACIYLSISDYAGALELCREYLKTESAPGSDAGLAVQKYDLVNDEICNWGKRAKAEILTQTEAREMAQRLGVYIEGFTGNEDGVIGSLAAIGLRKNGNDGRGLWVSGQDLREIQGIISVGELLGLSNIDAVTDRDYQAVPNEHLILTFDWMKPIIRDHKLLIIADKSDNPNEYEWQVTTKDYIKSISG